MYESVVLSAGGLTQPHTMKLQGEMMGRKVLVSIDRVLASHNFISTKLVQRLKLTVEGMPTYSVKLGDGFRRSTCGFCENIVIKLENHIVKEKFYVFELGGVDVILGVAWLGTLGDVEVNWKALTMTFPYGGRRIQIRGDPSLRKTLLTPKALKKEREIAALTCCGEQR